MADLTTRTPGRVRRRPWWHRALAVGFVAVMSAAAVPSAASAQSETPAEKAAREIQEARDRANAAAGDYLDAQSVLDQLVDELTGLQAEEVGLQADVDALRVQVEAIALSRYIESGTEGIPLLTNVSEPQDQIQADVFVDVVTNSSADTLDQFDAAEAALKDTQTQIADRQAEVEAQKLAFEGLEQDALDEVELLREIENDRLQDEAVQKALEAQLAKERAAIEEQARLDAEAAARAQPNPGLVVPPPTTTIPPDATPAGTTPDGEPIVADTQPAAPPAATTPTESTLPPNSGGSGGTSGGRTGGGGGGNNPAGVGNGVTIINGLACPMPGSAYADTWGAARSGGRRHEGVDMIAPRGLPIFAVVGGVVTFKSNALGGNAVSLVGDDGNRYYYAHLDSYVGTSRQVSQGELIGYNGDSGNAKFSTPHLHFQVHPGGGQAVNPTPTVRLAGC
jgi:peptidoglycan LD-endopeptidase LytH